MPVFTDILQQGRQNFQKPGFPDARDWYREKAREVRNINTTKLIKSNPEYRTGSITPGFMYMFAYDALHKDTLPYYDRFPLIFPFSADSTGFMGINLHYLPHLLRARLMDALYNLVSNAKFDDKTRLRMSYDILNGSAKYKYFKPCVKRYLFSQMQTKFLMIPSSEWDIALFLPLERFTVNKAVVYKDSTNLVKR
jgi:hypothetical protein